MNETGSRAFDGRIAGIVWEGRFTHGRRGEGALRSCQVDGVWATIVMMKALFVICLACSLICPLAARADDLSVDDRYVNIYALILQGDAKWNQGQSAAAVAKYSEAQTQLKSLKRDYPDWNTRVVKFRLDYLAAKAASAPPAPHMDAASGGPVEMKLKWEVGKRYLQNVDMSQTMDLKAPGSAESMKQETKQRQEIAISALKERDGGGRELEMEFVSMAMNMKMGDTTMMDFDSKKGGQDTSANPGAAMLGKLAGTRVKLITDANGKVESVEGFEDFLKQATSGTAPEMAEMMKGFLSEDNLKQMSAGNMGLPDKPVKIGDTWPVKTEMSLGPMGAMVMNLTYTFKGWEQHDNHKCAALEYSGDISIKPGDASTGTTLTVDNGKATGTTWFDPAMGMIIETSGKQDVALKINTMGQAMSTQMHQNMNNKLVEVTDIPK